MEMLESYQYPFTQILKIHRFLALRLIPEEMCILRKKFSELFQCSRYKPNHRIIEKKKFFLHATITSLAK